MDDGSTGIYPVSKSFTDQLGTEVVFSFPPKKIVSLVPSQTEFLFDLGLDEEIIGITKFCIHPNNQFKKKPKVGGTKKLNLEKIRSLNPDLIVANKEENTEAQVRELMQYSAVWISNVVTIDDSYLMMHSLGKITGRVEESEQVINNIKSRIKAFRMNGSAVFHSAAYLIWESPLMVAGSNTFINTMLQVAGFENIFNDHLRYPKITITRLQQLSPEYILLSTEPFPFKEKHVQQFQELFPNSKILLVNGEMFSWYGSRMLKAPDYFRKLKSQ